jgi:molecular chaperone DnaJ
MDYYTLLGLAPGASVTDVKRAYRRLSRRYHPGINPGDREAELLFQRITEAYETLIDAERRRRYDATGVVAASGDPSFEFAGFDFSVKAHGPQAATFSELFADALHPAVGPEQARPQHGADLHAPLTLSFTEALTGADRQLAVTRQVACGSCGGAGIVRTADAKCAHCHGAGKVRWARGHMVFTKGCAACAGSGRERHRRCGACAGQGRLIRSESLGVRVPAGVCDGSQLRVPERGHAGAFGGRPGDLYLEIRVRPHNLLRRDGDDLFMTVPVTVFEAALGARIEVPSFDGPVRVKIPAGTQAGQRFRVSGRGAPTPHGERGDLFVEVSLALPPLADERSRELMRELAQLNTVDVRHGLSERFTQD